MKNFLFATVVAALFLSSCASSSSVLVYDTTIPAEQMSYLYVPNYIKVTQFNDKAVNWIASPLSMTPVKIGIPSGENILVIDTIISGNNVTKVPNLNGEVFTKTFEIGKSYQLINQSGKITIIELQ